LTFEALAELQQLTERLRRDCPWDRAQTARTIVPHTVEEAYEVADAALADDRAKLLDELGDLLFQVYFLAQLLQEQGAGDLEAVAREGVFHDLPETLPALLYARKVQRRARAVGFEYPDVEGALADLDDELRELKEAIAEAGGEPAPETEPDPHVLEELGDVLFAAVNVARRVNVDPELALRAMSGRFVARVERAEELAGAEGKRWTELGLDEQDSYFDRAKEAGV
jgi:uncharacterized protein YabN with tetrapyrrole methylase and pyrophosphatase domain